MSTPPPTFADRLYELRTGLLRRKLGRKVSQEDLAALLTKELRDAGHLATDAKPKHQSTIGDWESGESSADAQELLALCRIFEVSSDYLLGRVDSPIGIPVGAWILDEDMQDAMKKDKRKPGRCLHGPIPPRAKIINRAAAIAIAKDLGLQELP